jgi:hypothetical protein
MLALATNCGYISLPPNALPVFRQVSYERKLSDLAAVIIVRVK